MVLEVGGKVYTRTRGGSAFQQSPNTSVSSSSSGSSSRTGITFSQRSAERLAASQPGIYRTETGYVASTRPETRPQYLISSGKGRVRASEGFTERAEQALRPEDSPPSQLEQTRTAFAIQGSRYIRRLAPDRGVRVDVPPPYSAGAIGVSPAYREPTPTKFIRQQATYASVGRTAIGKRRTSSEIIDVRTGQPAYVTPSQLSFGVRSRSVLYDPVRGERAGRATQRFLGSGIVGRTTAGTVEWAATDPLRSAAMTGAAYGGGAVLGAAYGATATSGTAIGRAVAKGTGRAVIALSPAAPYGGQILAASATVNPEGFGRGVVPGFAGTAGFFRGVSTSLGARAPPAPLYGNRMISGRVWDPRRQAGFGVWESGRTASRQTVLTTSETTLSGVKLRGYAQVGGGSTPASLRPVRAPVIDASRLPGTLQPGELIMTPRLTVQTQTRLSMWGSRRGSFRGSGLIGSYQRSVGRVRVPRTGRPSGLLGEAVDISGRPLTRTPPVSRLSQMRNMFIGGRITSIPLGTGLVSASTIQSMNINPITAFNTNIAQDTNIVSQQNTITGSRIISGQSSTPATIQGLIGTSIIAGSRITPPTTPRLAVAPPPPRTPPPPPGIAGGLFPPMFGIPGTTTRRKRRGRRGYRYASSLVSVFAGFSGAAPTTIRTGLEVRPLVRGRAL